MLHQVLFALQIALAWYFGLSACAALLFVATRPVVRPWLRKERGASWPLGLRLLPSAFSVGTVVAAVLPAFAWLEPFGSAATGERLGVTATTLAVAGSALVFASLGRGITAILATRRRMRALHADATRAAGVRSAATMFVSESPVPCVVLDGLVRPRLFVSRTVFETLTPEELERAVAHELAHHRARDNVKRRVLAFAPDLVSGSRLARDLEAAWNHAAELEADAAASGGSEVNAVALASALIKVARLADGHPRTDLGRAAFHDGAPVADRIRVLCTRAPKLARSSRRLRGLVAAAGVSLACGATLSASSVLPVVHRVTEWLVHLP